MKYRTTAVLLALTLIFPVNVAAADISSEGLNENSSFGEITFSANDFTMDDTDSLDASKNEVTEKMNEANNSSGFTVDDSFSTDETENDFSQTMPQTESKSDIEKYQDAFDQSRTLMKDSLPTLETDSLDSMRSELTESVKNNASATLKELMGDSFSSLDSSLFDISGMPSSDSFSMESLNVHYAEMRKSFEEASSGVSGSLDSSSDKSNDGTKIGKLDEELSNWRNSDSYKSISGKISLSNVFGSLEKQLPSKNSETGSYNANVASQNKKTSSMKNTATSQIKKQAAKSTSSGNAKLKSAANSWANNKKKNPVTGKKTK